MKHISEQEIHQFYKEYKETVRLQDAYESILYFLYMKPQQKKKWFLLLREKSDFQKKSFEENERKIKEVIHPFLKDGEHHIDLTQETADAFLKEIIGMSKQLVFDSLLTIDVLKKLISFYIHTDNKDKQLYCYFYLGYFYSYMNNPQMKKNPLLCYEKVISYREQYEDGKAQDICQMIVLAYFNRTNWDVESELEFCSVHYKDMWEAYEFCVQEKRKGSLGTRFNIDNIITLLGNKICFELLKPGNEAGRDDKAERFEQEYYKKLEADKSIRRLTAYEFYNYWKHNMLLGKIEEKEYSEKLYQYYKEEPWEELKTKAEYNFTNMVQLMTIFQSDLFWGAEQYHKEWMPGLKENVRWFCTGFPRNGNKGYIDRIIVDNLMQVMPYYDKTEVMDLYEKVLFIRQGATEIHVRGVGKLVNEIAVSIIERHPEYIVGLLDIENKEEVLQRKDEILEFLWQCAMQHDRGKVFISATINMQLRALTEFEWQSIKKHTEYGLEGGEQYVGLKKYYNIILGHHKFFNGEGGYPETFDNVSCQDKFAIDLITICDCLDAATDMLGRNYNNSKTVSQVLKEFEEGKGVRYSPKIVDFVKSDPQLIEKLEEITGNGRKETYYAVYHLFAAEKEEKSPLRV